MNSFHHRPARGASLSRFLFLTFILFGLAGSGCGTAPTIGKILFEGPQGTVYLQHIPDRSFQANHPINLEPDLFSRVLKGLQIQDQERVLQNLIGGPSSPTPIFSQDQIRFLAPLLAEGLRTAAADQRVEYRVRTTRTTSALESSIVETTGGAIYAYDQALYVSLSQYRYDPSRTNAGDNAHRRPPDSSGLTNRTLLFTPPSAILPNTFRLPGTDLTHERLIAIDPRLLQEPSPSAKASNQTTPQTESLAKPVPAPQPGIRSSGSPTVSAELLGARDEEIRSLKDLVIKKDLELDALKSELQSIKRQLDKLTTPQESPARKNKRPPSRQEPTP